ncbi:MAG: archaeal heat shock protein Hsp20 [Candidatus Bathyarchaeia archaeon]
MFWDDDEDLPWWFRRRRRYPFLHPFFGTWISADIDETMRELERMAERMFKEFQDRVPKSLVREHMFPDGSVTKKMGPFIYGWSMTMGPDEKPIIREFGNLKPPTHRRAGWEPPFDLRDEREPLVDVVEGEAEIQVVAELPGVEKRDIQLYATGETLTISVDTPERKYHKELEFPAEVDPKSARSSYRNGVLQVTLAKRSLRKPKGESIRIE